MASNAIKFRAEPIRSLAFGSISGTYAAVGTALTRTPRIFIFNNATDADLMFSFEGTTDHVFLAAGASLVTDVCTNQVDNSGLFIAMGTQIFVKDLGAAASTGSVYVSYFYGKQ